MQVLADRAPAAGAKTDRQRVLAFLQISDLTDDE